MDTHITIIAVLNLVFGFMKLLAGAIVFVAIAGGGLLSGDMEALFITSTVATAISSLLLILSLPEIVTGFSLLARKKWSRILALIVAVLNLPQVPFSTFVGIYMLWVMLQDETIKILNK